MPTSPKFKLLLPALVLAALLALPATAGATLAYVKAPFEGMIFVADDNGHGARAIELGYSPRVSPDGNWVAYQHEGRKGQELKLAPSSGGPGKALMAGFPEVFEFAWSPDSTRIAAVVGPELGKRKLVLLDLATGSLEVIAKGFFSGFSFDPDDSGNLVYAKSGSEKYPPRSDVYRHTPGMTAGITRDHRSSYPLWGPNDQIVFVKAIDGKKRRYGPKNELYLMNPLGGQVKRLTHTKVDPLLQGLFPTEWSADGSRLLTEFQGQDVSYAVVVNPKTGAQRPVAGTGESGFVGTDLSADGKLVLGFNGGFDPGLRNHKVQTVPYAGGKPKTLVKEAFEPSWSR